MNDDDLQRRFARLRPADLPGGLFGRLLDAEPATCATQFTFSLRGGWAAWLRPWPLAYAGLGAAWVAILVLRLFTQDAPPVTGGNPVAQSAGDRTQPAPTNFTVGAPPDRFILLTRNNSSDFPSP